jgi:hypothetical protein
VKSGAGSGGDTVGRTVSSTRDVTRRLVSWGSRTESSAGRVPYFERLYADSVVEQIPESRTTGGAVHRLEPPFRRPRSAADPCYRRIVGRPLGIRSSIVACPCPIFIRILSCTEIRYLCVGRVCGRTVRTVAVAPRTPVGQCWTAGRSRPIAIRGPSAPVASALDWHTGLSAPGAVARSASGPALRHDGGVTPRRPPTPRSLRRHAPTDRSGRAGHDATADTGGQR